MYFQEECEKMRSCYSTSYFKYLQAFYPYNEYQENTA